jgi:transcriptional regulator GlxA family with amidase domain
MSTRIEIVIFDGFDEMDAIAPYEVFRTAAGCGAPIEADLVGAHGAATITASHGTRIQVDRASTGTADLVLVPGGGYFHGAGIRAELERGELPRLIADAHERGAIVGSVCTGAMLLAASGLTAGRRATTHHLAIDDLRASGAHVAGPGPAPGRAVRRRGDRRARGGRDRVRAAQRDRHISCRR